MKFYVCAILVSAHSWVFYFLARFSLHNFMQMNNASSLTCSLLTSRPQEKTKITLPLKTIVCNFYLIQFHTDLSLQETEQIIRIYFSGTSGLCKICSSCSPQPFFLAIFCCFFIFCIPEQFRSWSSHFVATFTHMQNKPFSTWSLK